MITFLSLVYLTIVRQEDVNMSSSRGKLKVTDVSAPIKVEHVSHVGKEDINIDDGNITLLPRPCTGTDRQVTTQV